MVRKKYVMKANGLDYIFELEFSDETPDEPALLDAMEKEFIDLYSKAVDLTDPKLKSWNAAWTRLNPGVEPADSDATYAEYNSFLGTMFMPYLREVSREGETIELYSDEEAAICGRCKRHPEWTVKWKLIL